MSDEQEQQHYEDQPEESEESFDTSDNARDNDTEYNEDYNASEYNESGSFPYIKEPYSIPAEAMDLGEAPFEAATSQHLALRPQPQNQEGLEFESESYQQTARGRITAFPFAMGLIALGGLMFIAPQINNFDVSLPVAVLIMIAALVLTNLFRFFTSGRRERGLLFLALFTMALGAVLALMIIAGETFTADTWYPLVLVGAAGALLVTYIFEREHERGLLGLAALILVAGLVALAVTQEIIPPDTADTMADYFPLLIAFIGITLIPLALRRAG